jgi:hypothetical protein
MLFEETSGWEDMRFLTKGVHPKSLFLEPHFTAL